MTYLQLLYEFFKTGLFAVGGGLATIPFLKEIADHYDWFSAENLTDMIAVSEATPGPIGVNMATYAGFNAAGILGGLVATLSLVLPSVVMICIISKFLNKFRNNRIVENMFYGIRPASTGLITGAMYSVLAASVVNLDAFALSGDFFSNIKLTSLVFFFAFTMIAFVFEKLHPIVIIALGRAVGIIFKM